MSVNRQTMVMMTLNFVWSLQRTVSYDGSNVDFGNPLYNKMNAEQVDPNPAYNNLDEKYMPGVGEVSSQSPYISAFNGNYDKSSEA